MKRKLSASVSIAALFLAASCTFVRARVAEPEPTTLNVALGAAKTVEVEVAMRVGVLEIVGGPGMTLNAEFICPDENLVPEVLYEIEDDGGFLEIEQPEPEDQEGRLKQSENRWNLNLKTDVPTELNVELGVGRLNLRPAGMTLIALDLELGVGDCRVDLTGDWTRNLDATIATGVGTVDIVLPNQVGVWVHAEAGLGSVRAEGLKIEDDAYVNDAWGTAEVNLSIEVETGVGEVNLKLAE